LSSDEINSNTAARQQQRQGGTKHFSRFWDFILNKIKN